MNCNYWKFFWSVFRSYAKNICFLLQPPPLDSHVLRQFFLTLLRLKYLTKKIKILTLLFFGMLGKSSKYLADHFICCRWTVNIKLLPVPQHSQSPCHVFHFLLLSPVKQKAKYVSNTYLLTCVLSVSSTKFPGTWICLVHWYSSSLSDSV